MVFFAFRAFRCIKQPVKPGTELLGTHSKPNPFCPAILATNTKTPEEETRNRAKETKANSVSSE